MICEIIAEPKNARGFTNLGRYLIGARAGVHTAGWDRLSAYLLGTENHRGEIVTDVRITNCRQGVDRIGLAVAEMAANNARCTTSRAPLTYHFVISLAPGEILTPEQFRLAEQRYIDAFGLGECQRISVTHNSKEHLHRHVAVATGSCEDRKNRRPVFDKLRALDISAELEIEFGLSRTNHERGTGKHHQNSLGEYAHEFAEEFVASKTWAELHGRMAGHGLLIKPRGDGLVIGSRENAKLHVRASRVHRELGKNRLEARLGSWEPDHEREPMEGREGAGEARQREYEAARANAAEARKDALAALRERQRAHADELAAFYSKRMRDALALGKGPSRRASVAMIIAQRKAAHQERIARQRLERQAVLDAHRGVNWREWRDAQRKQEQKQAREREEEKKQEQKNEQEQTRQTRKQQRDEQEHGLER